MEIAGAKPFPIPFTDPCRAGDKSHTVSRLCDKSSPRTSCSTSVLTLALEHKRKSRELSYTGRQSVMKCPRARGDLPTFRSFLNFCHPCHYSVLYHASIEPMGAGSHSRRREPGERRVVPAFAEWPYKHNMSSSVDFGPVKFQYQEDVKEKGIWRWLRVYIH